MAMIRSAPASRAPATAPRPTSPAPKTATVDPGSTLATYRAAPTPVVAPQASVQITSSGASGFTFARAISGITVASANVLVPMKWRTRSSPRWSRVVPSGRWPWFCSSRMAMQRFVRSDRQCTHSRH